MKPKLDWERDMEATSKDAATLRLIVEHKMDIHYSRYNKPRGWYASPLGQAVFLPGKNIHDAVRKAAKAGGKK